MPNPEPLTLEILQEAVTKAAAFRCRRRLQPAGGPGDKVFPPTYAGAVYAVEQRRLPGRPEPVTCVLLDSVQSQANRMELALQEAVDAGLIQLPLVVVDFTPWSPDGSKPETERLLDAVGKITSLQVPHRLADAILRDSQIEEEDQQGNKKHVSFRESAIGKRLNQVNPQNATPLFELCPTALVFGMWDSTGPKGGLGAKFERAMVSEIVGIGASLSELHKNRGVRRDPLEISKSVSLRKTADGGWEISEAPSAKGVIRPSEVNHSSVPFETDNAGVTIEYAEQITTLSLIVLRRLRFPLPKNKGESDEDHKKRCGEADISARTVLAALGLCAATLAFQNGAGLRSRCLLWPEEPMIWELLAKPGEEPQRFLLPSESAVELLKEAVKQGKGNGIAWEETPILLWPDRDLLGLVRLSQKKELTSWLEGETTKG